MKEVWHDIFGYEGMYQVSNLGRVKSLDRYVPCNRGMRLVAERILKQRVNKFGYSQVVMSKDNNMVLKHVHRLVAEAFIPNTENKEQVNHIDGCKHNNVVSNLEWVTRSENSQHAIHQKLWNPKFCGEISTSVCGQPVICLETQVVYKSISKASSATGLCERSIRKSINSGKTISGYTFQCIDKSQHGNEHMEEIND